MGAGKTGQVGFLGSCNVEEIGQGRKTAIVGEIGMVALGFE